MYMVNCSISPGGSSSPSSICWISFRVNGWFSAFFLSCSSSSTFNNSMCLAVCELFVKLFVNCCNKLAVVKSYILNITICYFGCFGCIAIWSGFRGSYTMLVFAIGHSFLVCRHTSRRRMVGVLLLA